MIPSFKEYISEGKGGTYAGVRFDAETNLKLYNFCISNGIPNPVPINKLHVTLLYSRKHLPNYEAEGDYASPICCYPKEFVVWETNGENKPKSRCLILKLNAPDLVERHKKLMDEHQATYDYPEYTVHVTLSYDIGDKNISGLQVNDKFEMNLVHEYQEVLKTDWAASL